MLRQARAACGFGMQTSFDGMPNVLWRDLRPGQRCAISPSATVDASSLGTSVIERPVQRTTLPAIDADAILLLSDGQFDASHALATTPMFPVVSSQDKASDARIAGIERQSQAVIVSVVNDGTPRDLIWWDGTTSTVPHGSVRVGHASPTTRGIVKLNASDAWPENDAVEIGNETSTTASERWWIGPSPPPGFRAIDPTALPPLEAWLAAREVVLNNVPASALDAAAQQTLTRYVRDLGGALTIVGGDHAFSAGGYGGTELDALSPLASRPPAPQREWLVLIDASGSMAAKTADGRTRLDCGGRCVRIACRGLAAIGIDFCCQFSRRSFARGRP